MGYTSALSSSLKRHVYLIQDVPIPINIGILETYLANAQITSRQFHIKIDAAVKNVISNSYYFQTSIS